ncbi:MAG: outer membrane beta-barrel protein [Muribaculaceae bacterium]
MKKIILILIAIFTLIPSTTFAQRGERTMGLMGGYNTRNQSGIAGIYFQYRFSKYFRLAPDFQYAFQHHNLSSFEFNGNAHFPLKLTTQINFYPLVGITYQSWRQSGIGDAKGTETSKRFGGNFGGGFEYMATPTLKLLVEGKYSLIKSYSSGGITLGIGYLF